MTKYQIQNEYIPRAWEMWELYKKGVSTKDIAKKYINPANGKPFSRQSIRNAFLKIGMFPIKLDYSRKGKQDLSTKIN